jgi:3-oxoacyl-[acyl-carrier-protein] synthase I
MNISFDSPLNITAAGACCSVGQTLAAASCAMRANMDHFRDSQFRTRSHEPIKVASLDVFDPQADDDANDDPIQLWGARRLAAIAVRAVQDCANQTADHSSPGIDTSSTALVLLVAEHGRPHVDVQWSQTCFEHIQKLMRKDFHSASFIVPWGKAGIAPALQAAHRLLHGKQPHNSNPVKGVSKVLLVGVDSYLNAATIEHYLAEQRLLVPDNEDGFIPGEGAAALLITAGADENQESRLTIVGTGAAREAAMLDGEIPNRAMGLTQAIRQACEQAQVLADELDIRMSDYNGESFYAREASTAMTRIMMDAVDAGNEGTRQPVIALADCVGETGAAAPVLALAYLSEWIHLDQRLGPNSVVLGHFANDDGARGAVIAQHPKTGTAEH